MSGGPLSFGAKTQGITAQSNVEAELTALAYGSKEAVYLSNFMMELGFKAFRSVPVNCDSTGALHLGGNTTYSSMTKHIALRFFFLRELVKTGNIASSLRGDGEYANRRSNQIPRQDPTPRDPTRVQGAHTLKPRG